MIMIHRLNITFLIYAYDIVLMEYLREEQSKNMFYDFHCYLTKT